VTTVIEVPPSVDSETFEVILQQVAAAPPDAKLLLDARHSRWFSPYGLTALLTLGQARGERMSFTVPEKEETAHYITRARFFEQGAEFFDIHGHVPRVRAKEEARSVLLEVTRIAGSSDVHHVVEQIQQRAQEILVTRLQLDPLATMRFATTLSEACQNIIEHAEAPGWVAVQTYKWTQRLGRQVVVIAVCDSGIGFRKSLEQSPGHRPSDRWDDARALEEAVIRGVSRFRERGRGQGLAGVRRFIGGWDGKLSVRSGTARIAIVPKWDDDVPLREGLPWFPGAQMEITIPERVPAP
jgi:anti-sigma regulatory factor (Ser/Thr protein kinase)